METAGNIVALTLLVSMFLGTIALSIKKYSRFKECVLNASAFVFSMCIFALIAYFAFLFIKGIIEWLL